MSKMKLLVSLAIVIGASWWFFSKDSGNAPQEQAQQLPPVTVSAPRKQILTEWDEYTGRFRSTERVEIRSRVSGYLEDIRFKDGDQVKEGEVLFVIDQRPFRIALDRTKAQFELATKELERTRKLQATSASSKQSLDIRTQEYQEAKAAYDEAKLNLEFSEVKAPISGRIGRHQVDKGNLVTGGDNNPTLLTTIVADQPIHFYFEASEQEYLKYVRLDREGKRTSSREDAKPVYVRLQDEQEFRHQGTMDFVDNEIDRATGTIQGRAVFDNKDGVLISGMFGRLRIAGSAEYEAMLIPEEAIATNQSQKMVYTVNNDGVVEARPVELGGTHEGTWRILRSGIKPDEQIIWTGLAKIRPQMKVNPVPLDTGSQSEEKTSEENGETP